MMQVAECANHESSTVQSPLPELNMTPRVRNAAADPFSEAADVLAICGDMTDRVCLQVWATARFFKVIRLALRFVWQWNLDPCTGCVRWNLSVINMPEAADFHGSLVLSRNTRTPNILRRYLRCGLNNHGAATLFPLDYVDNIYSQRPR